MPARHLLDGNARTLLEVCFQLGFFTHFHHVDLVVKNHLLRHLLGVFVAFEEPNGKDDQAVGDEQLQIAGGQGLTINDGISWRPAFQTTTRRFICQDTVQLRRKWTAFKLTRLLKRFGCRKSLLLWRAAA